MLRILVIIVSLLLVPLYSSPAYSYQVDVRLHHPESGKNIYLLYQGDIFKRQILIHDLKQDVNVKSNQN